MCPEGIDERVTQVESRRLQRHITRMSLRLLFATLIAAAMMCAPFVMRSGRLMAAMPSDHHAQTMGEGHCEGSPADNGGDSADKPCCAAMCAAIAVAAVSPADRVAPARSVERLSLKQSLHGYLAKLPTPPPRLA